MDRSVPSGASCGQSAVEPLLDQYRDMDESTGANVDAGPGFCLRIPGASKGVDPALHFPGYFGSYRCAYCGDLNSEMRLPAMS